MAAGAGTFAIGVFIILTEISSGIKGALNWWNPAGPLSGKTGMGILVWLVTWHFLNRAWKDRDVDLARYFRIAMILVAIGFLLTFPPVFTLFAAH